jgi:hypothetical protein
MRRCFTLWKVKAYVPRPRASKRMTSPFGSRGHSQCCSSLSRVSLTARWRKLTARREPKPNPPMTARRIGGTHESKTN